MSLGTRRIRERRQRTRMVLIWVGKWLVVVCAMVGIGIGAHRAGTKLAAIESEQLAADLALIKQQNEQLGQENIRFRAEREQAQSALAALQQRLDGEVPTGTVAEILVDVRERLAGGLRGERIRQVLRGAGPVQRCDGPPVARRFRIAVPPRVTAEDVASFAEGMIRVQASAAAVADDMARNAVVTFSGLASGGAASSTGLPASHVFVLNNMELVVNVSDSQIPGFLTAAITGCRGG